MERFVTHRQIKHAYGTPVSMRFNLFDPEHFERMEAAHPTPMGVMIDGGFSSIMPKVMPPWIVCVNAQSSEELYLHRGHWQKKERSSPRASSN